MKTKVHWLLLISGIAAVFRMTLTEECPISLPQDQIIVCREFRLKELALNQMSYRLVTGGSNPFAHLDLDQVQLASVLALDPGMPDVTKQCAVQYGNMTHTVAVLFKGYLAKELGESVEELTKKIPPNVRLALKDLGIDISGLLNIFGNIIGAVEFAGVMQTYEDYKDLQEHFSSGMESALGIKFPGRENETMSEALMHDDYFAQQRLAGVNPMSLQIVRTNSNQQGGVAWEDLKRTINPDIHSYIEQLTSDGRSLFMVRYPLCDDLPKQIDLTDINPIRKMEKTRSPIALFVTDTTFRGGLAPVAIQMDYTPDSPVYTPKDQAQWEVAKLNVQTTDLVQGQILEHLLKVHFATELMCVSIKRQLSNLHPIRQIMNFHCADVFVPNIFGGPLLLDPRTGFMRLLFASGSKGADQLLKSGYHYITWDSLDFEQNIQDRGLSVEPAYFPYRDDGNVIVNAINKMVGEYVDNYYDEDSDVQADTEIQNFADEVSAEGTVSPDGKIRGFPNKITTKDQLKDVFNRLIWHVTGQHASVNYELLDVAGFVPNMPTKTYQMTNSSTLPFNILANQATAAIQASLTASLGSLRCDQLFDYYNKLEDGAGALIVQNHYHNLQQVTDHLDAVNKQRLADKQLTYPYMLPRWLPNGIQT